MVINHRLSRLITVPIHSPWSLLIKSSSLFHYVAHVGPHFSPVLRWTGTVSEPFISVRLDAVPTVNNRSEGAPCRFVPPPPQVTAELPTVGRVN